LKTFFRLMIFTAAGFSLGSLNASVALSKAMCKASSEVIQKAGDEWCDHLVHEAETCFGLINYDLLESLDKVKNLAGHSQKEMIESKQSEVSIEKSKLQEYITLAEATTCSSQVVSLKIVIGEIEKDINRFSKLKPIND